MPERIYFDNAATSFPKPNAVHEAMMRYARQVGASAGRGAYQEAVEAGQIIQDTRQQIAQLLGAENPNYIIMTFNCTDGLVLAIKGIVTQAGDHVVTTRMEHNSVLRPLYALQEQLGIEVTYVEADPEGLVDPDDIKRAIKNNTKLIVTVHASNVSGSLQDTAVISTIARQAGIPYLLDAAQTAGHLPIDVRQIEVDMLVCAGHKGLLGPLGTGIMYIRPGMEHRIRPLKEGGTGSRSEQASQPDFLPDRFESGSHNTIGIAGLSAGVKYLQDKGLAAIRTHELKLMEAFLKGTSEVEGLKVYGPTDLRRRVGVFSVSMEGFEPAELAAVLEEQFGLLTRPGLHCAPFAHQTLGTFEAGGTVRFSTGPFNNIEDIEYATNALKQIAQTHVKT